MLAFDKYINSTLLLVQTHRKKSIQRDQDNLSNHASKNGSKKTSLPYVDLVLIRTNATFKESLVTPLNARLRSLLHFNVFFICTLLRGLLTGTSQQGRESIFLSQLYSSLAILCMHWASRDDCVLFFQFFFLLISKQMTLSTLSLRHIIRIFFSFFHSSSGILCMECGSRDCGGIIIFFLFNFQADSLFDAFRQTHHAHFSSFYHISPWLSCVCLVRAAMEVVL